MAKIEIEKSRFSRLTDEQHSLIVDAIQELAEASSENARSAFPGYSDELKEEITRDLEGLENFAFIDPEESEIYREAIEKAARIEETEGEG